MRVLVIPKALIFLILFLDLLHKSKFVFLNTELRQEIKMACL